MSLLGIVFDSFCDSKHNLYCLLTIIIVFIVSHCAVYFVHHQSDFCKIATLQNPSICSTFHACMVSANQDHQKTRSLALHRSAAARSTAAYLALPNLTLFLSVAQRLAPIASQFGHACLYETAISLLIGSSLC